MLQFISLCYPPGSPWASKLSTAILKLGESGILDYLHHKWWETSCFHKGQDAWSPLKPQAMGGLFLVLAVGLTLGVIVALVELANKSRHAAEQEKVSGAETPPDLCTSSCSCNSPRTPSCSPTYITGESETCQ